MLRYLEISNIALIDSASIDFGTGLCVLTGETGAGKSIIIDSINAILGARTTRDIVRKGAGAANVSAIFSINKRHADNKNQVKDKNHIEDRLAAILADNGVNVGQSEDNEQPFDEGLILSREISASGRSVCRINGTLVTSPALRAVGELMVDLHGQHENHSLMKRENHIEMIDSYGGTELSNIKEQYVALFSRYNRIKKAISDLTKSESERTRAIDILTFQVNEIKAVKPRLNEDERLAAQIDALANAEKISNALIAAGASLGGGGSGAGGGGGDGEGKFGGAYGGSYGGGSYRGGGAYGDDDAGSALAGIVGAEKHISQITQYSKTYADIAEKLAEARFIVEDAASAIRAATDTNELSPGRLDQLSERHEAIERLKRKYGGSVPEVHKFYKDALDKLEELAGSERKVSELENELGTVAAKMEQAAARLTGMRKDAAEIVERGVVGELADLEMANCRFEVLINSAGSIDGYGARGRDQLEFLFCANPGEELKPLTRIASGGEMSRVMLAIKSVLVGSDDIETMIFDEIDAGISGRAASRMAEKMHLLSKGRQIICVTHLAQIACMADDQFMIEKSTTGDDTLTNVYKLDPGSRTGEISRMLGGGSPTEASMRLSNELLDRAAQFKINSANAL